MAERSVLISGAGIAGLTLAILLKQHGWRPLVVEREPTIATEGYMMDFFGSGWDVAERMGLVDRLRAIDYPIDTMEYVDEDGDPWLKMPIDDVRRTLSGRYTYLRRSDLEQILAERATATDVEIRYRTTIESLTDRGDGVAAELDNGASDGFDLVVGADGVHSNVRELVFGPEASFANYLGYYVAAFHLADHDYPIGRSFKLRETADRVAGFYPLDARLMDATYIFRHADVGRVSPEKRVAMVRHAFAGSGWICEQVLKEHGSSDPIFFDGMTQIAMPGWSKGRVTLIGDACGCLTLLAGQGSHVAMAGAYILANELHRNTNHAAAFAAYERFLRPQVIAKQKSAQRFAGSFVPSADSQLWLRHLVMRAFFSRPLLGLGFKYFGASNVLRGYG